MRVKNLPFRVETAVFKSWHRLAGRRPGSAPFVSGDSFREIADYVLDDQRGFDPHNIHPGAVVFVEARQLPRFIADCLPDIREPFVLVTHNGDLNIDESYIELADDHRVSRWFAQNALLRHAKVTGIPIGLENRRYHANGVLRDFRVLRHRASPKAMRILYGFTPGTNERERMPALKALRSTPLADSMERINSRAYRVRLARYGFVASPPGNGVDCHRTWEALYLHSIPIVKRSSLYDSFPGLPVLAVDDWSDIFAWDPSFLEAEYKKLSTDMDKTPYLWFEYWSGLIKRARMEAIS